MSQVDYNIMKKNGIITAKILHQLKNYTQVGTTTEDINKKCKELLDAEGAISAAYQYGFPPFPAYICTSVNNVICHGIPNNIPLKKGDLISLDLCLHKNGHYSDSCISFAVGKRTKIHKKILQASYKTMMAGISVVKNGVSIYEISKAMETAANNYGFVVSKEFAGHGIGLSLHCSPLISFYPLEEDKNVFVKTGDYITIEPIIVQCNSKKYKRAPVIIAKDGWTAKSLGLSSQFEHTVLVKENSCEIITALKEEKPKGE